MDSKSDMDSNIPAEYTQKPPSAITATEDTPLQTKSELALQRRERALDERVGQGEGSARRKLYQRLSEGLDAERVSTVLIDGKPEEKREPDMATRHKYLETGLKVIGDLVEIKTEVNVDNSQRTLQISPTERQELEVLRGKIFEVKNENKEVVK